MVQSTESPPHLPPNHPVILPTEILWSISFQSCFMHIQANMHILPSAPFYKIV